MIRQCFLANTGIIFDAHMLQHEVGLDIDRLYGSPPSRLSPADDKRVQPAGKKLVPGPIKFIKIIWASVSLPFVWLITKIRNLKIRSGPRPVFTTEESRFVSEGEEREELHDALAPIYDQLNMHGYWKVMEWIPWITKKQRAEIDGSDAFWAYQFMYVLSHPLFLSIGRLT
jgi:hypothetical protein